MSNAVSYEIDKNLYLITQTLSLAPTKVVATPTNHLAVLDCSGSMSSDLPKIREQLKRKLPKLLQEGDTLSLIWFSGRKEFGVLFEAEPVATLKDLQDIHKQIDRWLKPIGMTGFQGPLEEVQKLTKRIKNKNPFSLYFMTDGHENQGSREQILKLAEVVGRDLAASTFVEYGYYADRALIASMAAKAGGAHIFAEAFDKYEPLFESAMAKRPLSAKRVEVDLRTDPVGDFVFAIVDEDIVTYEAQKGKVWVPEGVTQIWFLTANVINIPSEPLFPQS